MYSHFGGSGPAKTAHGLLDLKQEIYIQIQICRRVISISTRGLKKKSKKKKG
jgi:hypothetical protein